jgi:septum formation topological specificity factor MinE
MATTVGSSARQGARKWLANLLGESVLPQATSAAASKEAKNASRSIAKERLQIILAHQRGSQILAGVNLQALQSELLQVVQVIRYRYLHIYIYTYIHIYILILPSLLQLQRHIQVANGANINLAGINILSYNV